MKSRWNCGSITCIMCFTCVGSQLSINSSSASNFSGPLQLCSQKHKYTNRGHVNHTFLTVVLLYDVL
uniref:Secreted protein n=1 Tax=Astyanax mexicanus TaxID=7994 RepID=A0A8B9HD66_ASTMX